MSEQKLGWKKRFRIKYEDRKGECHIEVIYAYNKTDVENFKSSNLYKSVIKGC